MRTKLETRLSQIQAPDAPPDLKARCQQTIPADARLAPAKSRGFLRPLSAPKLGLATIVVATAIGLAFWNTRPVSNKTAPTNSNVAFAQTVEAMKNVTYSRSRSWKSDRYTIGASPRVTNRSWSTDEFDLAHGVYNSTDPKSAPIKGQPLELGNSSFDRVLALPNGNLYRRAANSDQLTIELSPMKWSQIAEFAKQISGVDASSIITLGEFTGSKPKHISSSEDIWKGRKVNVHVFRATFSEEERKRDPVKDRQVAAEGKIYVDPETKLIVARQSFILFADGSRIQKSESEIDYTRPDPSVFDPARLKIGAQIVDNRQSQEQVIARPR